MYTTFAFHSNKLEHEHRLGQAAALQLRATSGRQGTPRRRAGRRALLGALVTATALAFVPAIASAQSASPQSLNDIAINTGPSDFTQVLDVAGASRLVGAPVIQWYSRGSANQQWNVTPDPNGYEHIVNVNSGLCLATNGVPGNYITQWPCSNSTQEDWSGELSQDPFSRTSNNGQLENPESGMYLSVNGDSPLAGAQLVAWYSSDNLSQAFLYVQY